MTLEGRGEGVLMWVVWVAGGFGAAGQGGCIEGCGWVAGGYGAAGPGGFLGRCGVGGVRTE